MARADDPRPSDPPVPTPPRSGRRRPPWATGMICVTMLPLLGFIGKNGHSLWSEWAALGSDRTSARAAAVVGYPGISPNPSFAERPLVWKRDEGDRTLLWSGWADGSNRWFSFGRGELDGLQLSFPLGRDAVQAIDRPIFQASGDPFWGRVPDEAKIVPLDLGGSKTACPILVLDKVEVINGLSGDRPVLVAFTPLVAEVAVYDATIDGRRVTMGHSGFFDVNRPILYDRGTESFWVARDGAMLAVAGPRKGASLRRIALIEPVLWGTWKSENPSGRLLVGADRTEVGKPAN